MVKNVGPTDKIIRYVLAVVFIVLAIKVSWIFWILAVIAAGTAFFGTCGIYQLLGISTNK
ncbi:MAG: DUF2892 domain-containing protein [Firmicutes bacterium]|nr:DUF2892 domain-containing protein [Bacillota bacterium]